MDKLDNFLHRLYITKIDPSLNKKCEYITGSATGNIGKRITDISLKRRLVSLLNYNLRLGYCVCYLRFRESWNTSQFIFMPAKPSYQNWMLREEQIKANWTVRGRLTPAQGLLLPAWLWERPLCGRLGENSHERDTHAHRKGLCSTLLPRTLLILQFREHST